MKTKCPNCGTEFEVQNPEWLSKGGQSKSEAKKAASRENGKKGGRPRTKKMAIIILVLLISSPCYAGLFGRVEMGPNIQNSAQIYFTDIEIGYRFRFCGVTSETYAGTMTWAYYESVHFSGKPFEDIYSINQSIKWNGLFIHLRHYCAHSVNPAAQNSVSVANSTHPDWWYGTTTTVSVGYEWELR
jgi:hypothetical protein